MDAFSSPASTMMPAGGGGALPATAHREPLVFRTTAHLPPYPHLSNKPPSSSLSQPSSTRAHSAFLTASGPPPRSTALLRPNPRITTYTRASTGYAAALVDFALSSNAAEAVERDARRLLRELRPVLLDPHADEARKAERVRRAVEEGRRGFSRQVVVLVRMLVGKGKAGIVGEVMEEVGRLCDELSGTRVVVVESSSLEEGRIGEAEMAGIAQRVQRKSGAFKVKVRHVVREGQTSSSSSHVFA